MDKEDELELRSAIASLKLQYFKGSANVCENCKQVGNFGTIPKYECESGNQYILCGWCGKITRVKDLRSTDGN